MMNPTILFLPPPDAAAHAIPPAAPPASSTQASVPGDCALFATLLFECLAPASGVSPDAGWGAKRQATSVIRQLATADGEFLPLATASGRAEGAPSSGGATQDESPDAVSAISPWPSLPDIELSPPDEAWSGAEPSLTPTVDRQTWPADEGDSMAPSSELPQHLDLRTPLVSIDPGSMAPSSELPQHFDGKSPNSASWVPAAANATIPAESAVGAPEESIIPYRDPAVESHSDAGGPGTSTGRELVDASPTSPSATNTGTAQGPQAASALAALLGVPTTGPSPAVRSGVPAPVTLPHAGWEPALSERVAWQISERIHTARVEINPPELGPLEVHVRFDGDQARVHFVAEAPAAREALEHGLPRLRELLHDSGVDLIDVSVGQHGRGARHFADAPGWPSGTRWSDPPVEAVEARVLSRTGLVDYYI